jgi:cytochrome c-type protein NapB
MQRNAHRSFWMATALVPLLILGAGSADDMKAAKDGLDLYFRDGALLALTEQDLPVYPDTPTGESALLPHDFPDAPPLIPHTVEDMYPITLDENECLDCHDPENAISKEDVPLPESHFQAAVMGKGGPGDPMIWVVKDYKKIKDVVGARYNCDMCHTPQAENVDTPNSRFVTARKKRK